MDKETLSNYGWITICVLILAVMIALATPFGSYVKNGVESTATGFVETSEKGIDVAKLATGTPNNNGGNEPYTPIIRNGTIPDGATYYKGGELCDYCEEVYGIQGMNHGPMCDASYTFTQSPTATYTSGQEFPQTVEVGYIYIEDDFRYSYFSDGWHVSVLEEKAQYNGTILSEINGKKVTSMYYTFYNCTSLTTAPTIPNGVTDMYYTFAYCYSLTTAPTIPSSVTDMECTFYGCTSLTGTIEVNANPTYYDNCLKSTQITGITGSCSQATKDALMATK